MKKLKLRVLLLGLGLMGVVGCAPPNYFPLRNEVLLSAKTAAPQKAVVLPFSVELQYEVANLNNNQMLAKEKSEQAEKFVITALREELPRYGFEVIDYVPLKDFNKDNLDDDRRLTIISELLTEYARAAYDIRKNLDEEKGKNFDYSLGIGAEELSEEFSPRPDVFVRVFPAGYVMNLKALDNTALNTTAAILSLGMSKLFPVSDDILSVEIALIDAHTGDIFWVNTYGGLGQSLLVDQHVHVGIIKLLERLKDVRKGAL